MDPVTMQISPTFVAVEELFVKEYNTYGCLTIKGNSSWGESVSVNLSKYELACLRRCRHSTQ